MNKDKPLLIGKKEETKGLYTFCNKCKTLTKSGVCKTTGKSLKTCDYGDKHVYKAIFSIPMSNGRKRKTKILPTRNIKEAIVMTIDFEKELMENDYQNDKTVITDKKVIPIFLIHGMAAYVGYLNNEGVEEHKKRIRSKDYIDEVERFLKYFCLALKNNCVNHTHLKINQVNDKLVGYFYDYLINKHSYSNKYYNKAMAQLRQFFNWLIVEKEVDTKNPFIKVTRKKEVTNKMVITSNEFEQLLAIITLENGVKTLSTGERKCLYKPWLTFAFKLALETGLRREEFMTLKFSDINYGEDGSLTYFKQENFKVNRIKGIVDKSAKEMKTVPITNGVMDLLMNDLNYTKYKSSDKYLIAPNEKITRKTMIDLVSKAFSFYWSQIDDTKKLQLKHLRKTYISQMAKKYGEQASIITSHASIDVMKKHYINEEIVGKVASEFSVFD